MDPDREEEQEEYMANLIAVEDDITTTYLNDSGEGAEDLERRDDSGEVMEGEVLSSFDTPE
jgi:hypothetical protein